MAARVLWGAALHTPPTVVVLVLEGAEALQLDFWMRRISYAPYFVFCGISGSLANTGALPY
jgi:hypothetical protein